jgi:hypothetical protein
MMADEAPQNIHQALHAVKSALALHGIGKEGVNKEQHYSFRAVDDVIAKLSELFVAHRINVIPRMVRAGGEQRGTTSRGSPITASFVDAEFDLVSVDDGSFVTFKAPGEGSDMSDKGTNKAMSAAFKYAMVLGFVIPVEGVLDEGDAATPLAETRASGDDEPPPRQRSATGGNEAEAWARRQITDFNAYTATDGKAYDTHVTHPEYIKLKARLKAADEKLWGQVDTAQKAAGDRTDDVPF